MRKIANENGILVKAYAGTTGVLLALNIEPQKRAGLLGFALEKKTRGDSNTKWLEGQLHFPGVKHEPGTPVPTNEAPIQKFRWSDFAVYPGTEYEYIIHPAYGTPGHLELQDGPSLTVQTADMQQGEHHVLFNRAAAASQAFSRKFISVEQSLDEELHKARKEHRKPAFILPPDVLTWLSRGLLEQIVDFIERAQDQTWALDIAIYQYELSDIVRAVEAAQARGVHVRIVYHAKPGDDQTVVNESNLARLSLESKRARITNAICHHKFIVLSRVADNASPARTPAAVLCGSTNFTENGIYHQANLVHVVERRDIAGHYLDLFESLFRGDDQAATRRYITTTNQIEVSHCLFSGFSPRKDGSDLRAFVATIQAARRDVLFCTTFDLNDDIENALLGQPNDDILRYGLQNTRSKISGVHADRTADFAAAAMISSGLEGFLKEITMGQRRNILIHTKLIIVDFTSDAPLVISGSHNFSRAASHDNDENFLIVRDNLDVADAYGCELMRLYDHYRFRFKTTEQASSENVKQLTLDIDDCWTNPYFEQGSLKMYDRLRFSGE